MEVQFWEVEALQCKGPGPSNCEIEGISLKKLSRLDVQVLDGQVNVSVRVDTRRILILEIDDLNLNRVIQIYLNTRGIEIEVENLYDVGFGLVAF